MPHIMHVLVDGMDTTHMAGRVYTHFHPFKKVLDFTKDLQPCVGIIDWGLIFCLPNKQASHNLVEEAHKNPKKGVEVQEYRERLRPKRIWLDPNMYNPLESNTFSVASDVYALEYLFVQLFNFWKIELKV